MFINSLNRCIVTQNLDDGFDTAVQMSGVGNLKPNTVLIEWKNESPLICNQEATKYLDRVSTI